MSKKSKPSQKQKTKPAKPPKFEADLLQEAIDRAVAEKMAAASPKKEIPKGTCPPESIELYHQKGEGSYWLKEKDEKTGAIEYVKYKPSQLTRRFKWYGMTEAMHSRGLREIDWPFHVADTYNRIDYCGPLAGHRSGKFVDDSGSVFLVTKEAKGVWDDLPKKHDRGDFIMAFTLELFQQPGEWEHFMHWCAKALSSLRRGDFRPGPILGLAGPPECGKSLLQWIIKQLLGGRSAKPWKYMMGEEKHNYDMVTAEVLIISDPPATTDTRARRAFGNMMKDVLFDEEFRIRAMGKDALNAPLFHRLIVAVNDEVENLMVYPPIDTSLKDKLSLLKCSRVIDAFKRFDIPERQLKMELSESAADADPGDQDRSGIKRQVLKEIHDFRALLLREWLTVPNPFVFEKMGNDPQMRTRRTGLCAYQNPELFEALTSMSPEVRLMMLIDQLYFSEPGISEISRRAHDVKKELLASEYGQDAQTLLGRWDNACGTYLGRAAKLYPERISREMHGGGVPYWTIKPPPKTDEQKETE